MRRWHRRRDAERIARRGGERERGIIPRVAHAALGYERLPLCCGLFCAFELLQLFELDLDMLQASAIQHFIEPVDIAVVDALRRDEHRVDGG
jgi:hypothetical protein